MQCWEGGRGALRHMLYPMFTLTLVCARALGSRGSRCIRVHRACKGCLARAQRVSPGADAGHLRGSLHLWGPAPVAWIQDSKEPPGLF